MKKILSLVLCLCMLLTALPLAAMAEDYKEPITLNVFSEVANFGGEQKGWFAKEVKDRFNITLNFISSNVDSNAYSAGVAAGSLGDIICLGDMGEHFTTALKADLLMDLSDIDMTQYPTLNTYFTKAFEELGGTVVSEDFPEGNANFVSYINNAKSAGAGVIFCPVSINYAQLIVEAAAAQGFEGALLGSDTLDSNMVVEAAKGTDTELYVTTFYQEGGAPDFDSGIKEWMNANPDALTNNGGNDMIAAVTAMGYDAYFVALEAVKAAGSTAPADILAALPGVTYSGISGDISFNEIGDANRDSAFIKTANTETGEWDFVAVQGID